MSSRLLLVEDEDAIRTIAAISLERIGGWDVTPVCSGQAALAAAREEGPFDVVLMDVMMPGIDGPATLARMRDGLLADTVAVVFLTAKLGANEQERLLSLGAAGVIAKPFDPMTLSDELRRLLDG
jgi:two-component system OmpR family response regulator